MDAFPIPPVGNFGAQLTQGQSLLDTASKVYADPTGPDALPLLQAGITLAQNVGGEGGTIARKLVALGSAVASGFAVGGPIGAAVGLAAGIGGILTGLFQGYQGVVLGQITQGVADIAKRQAQWYGSVPQNMGVEFTNPQGWTLYDYLSRDPRNGGQAPSYTKRGAALYALRVESYVNLSSTFSFFANVEVSPLSEQLADGNSPVDPDHFRWVFPSSAAYLAQGGAGPDGNTKGPLQSLCTPVLWQWMQPSLIQDCLLNEWFGWPPAHDVATYKSFAQTDIYAEQGRSSAVILASALARAPDPLYFDANLYALQYGSSTYLYNYALLVALSTVLGMLQIGASTRAIVSELLLQQKILHDSDGHVPAGVQMLVNDYVALGQAEVTAQKTPLGGQPRASHHPSKPVLVSLGGGASSFAKSGSVLSYSPPSSSLPWVVGGTAAVGAGAWGLARRFL